MVERDMTIKEWCDKRHYSLTTFYNLKKVGHAPDLIDPPGIRSPRITHEADRRWEEKMRQLNKEKAAKREAERRSALATKAGKIAAASPNHIFQRRRAAKQKAATAPPKRGRPRNPQTPQQAAE